jgi:DNA polymerase-4
MMINEIEQDIHPLLLKRKIIHFDMDAFYAAVEIRDDPSLQGKPIVIGGPPNSRSVVCTASYPARRYGIRSAMACSKAARLCPEALFIMPNFEKYKAASLKIREIFSRYTDLIEPLSLDEAYLDVTNNKLGLYAVQIAKRIKLDIETELCLTGSAGVAPNKLVAKIASDINKPNGLTVVLPYQVRDFMRNLPLRKINGIGPVTEKRLNDAGLFICCDVWKRTFEQLEEALGENTAHWLFDCSRGIDDSEVETTWVRKSLGQEETFASDVLDCNWLVEKLQSLCRDVSFDLKRHQLKGRTVTIKVKYADFKQITRSQSLDLFVDDCENIFETAKILLEKTEVGVRQIRLLGVSVANFN